MTQTPMLSCTLAAAVPVRYLQVCDSLFSSPSISPANIPCPIEQQFGNKNTVPDRAVGRLNQKLKPKIHFLLTWQCKRLRENFLTTLWMTILLNPGGEVVPFTFFSLYEVEGFQAQPSIFQSYNLKKKPYFSLYKTHLI